MTKNNMVYLPLLLLLLGVIFWGVFFWEGEKKYDKMLEEFTSIKINGTIKKSKEKDRGFHLIEINDHLSDSVLKYSVPKSWFFKENSIQIGDSVSKEANSKRMTFYKLRIGAYEKCCEYEIGM